MAKTLRAGSVNLEKRKVLWLTSISNNATQSYAALDGNHRICPLQF